MCVVQFVGEVVVVVGLLILRMLSVVNLQHQWEGQVNSVMQPHSLYNMSVFSCPRFW